MKQSIKKYTSIAACSAFIALSAGPKALLAATTTDPKYWGGNSEVTTSLTKTFGTAQNPQVIIGGIINLIMGFLGIIAVVLVLLGGFKWMTAAGNEDKVEEAKKVMISGIVGLLIVLSAWAIATFVVGSLSGITTAK